MKLKITVTKIKITVNGFNSIIEGTEERINDLGDGTIKITHFEQQKEINWKKKMNGASGTYGYKRMSIINIIGVPEEEKAGEAEKVLKDTMAKKNPQIWKKTKLQIRSRMDPEQNKLKAILTKHLTVKLLEKIKILKSAY